MSHGQLVDRHLSPTAFALHPVASNPSRGHVSVRFDLPEAADVSLAAIDVLGREVAQVVDGRVEAGTHEVHIDGSAWPPGLYVVRLRAGTFVATRTLTLVR